MLFGLALYWQPLHSATFYYDDNIAIVHNQSIKSLDLPKIFNAFNTRFLVGLSFALNYKWCGLDPVGYRWTNLLIHCLNAFLVYLLIKSTLGLLNRDSSPSRLRMTTGVEWPALFASLLFLCHPIQTEPVNFITQRFVLMGTLFYLLTLNCYIQYRCRSKKIFLVASFISAVAAMFCKEFVVTLPLILSLYDFYFLNGLPESWWKRCRLLLPFFLITLIVPLLLLRTPPETVGVAAIADTKFIQKGNVKIIGNDITLARGGVSRKEYFLTELNVVRTYVRLLFLPINQNLDYDYPISSKIDIKTTLSGIFLLCLLAGAWITYRSYRIISFGILWFFIALSVESSFIPIGHVIAEYRLYLASVGFSLLMTSLIYLRQVDVKKSNIVAAVILIGFSILAYQRNQIWKDEFTLWNDTVQKSPHKARPYYSRGLLYFNQGKLPEAISDYSKAIELNSDYGEAYNNRGEIYAKQQKFTQAMSDYNKTIKIYPNEPAAYINLGSVYIKKGDLAMAISNFNKAVEIDPNNAEAFYNRGNIYAKQGKITEAMSDFNRAIDIRPQFTEVYSNRGNIYLEKGDFLDAIADFNKVLAINPKDAEAYYNLGSIYAKQGDPLTAITDLNKAIQLNPKNEEAYNNLSFIYSSQGDLTEALLDCNKAIAMNPQDAKAYNNCGLINARQENNNQSILDYNKAIVINPLYTLAYYNRSISYYQLQEYDKAWDDLHQAEELGLPINPDFRNALTQASGRNE